MAFDPLSDFAGNTIGTASGWLQIRVTSGPRHACNYGTSDCAQHDRFRREPSLVSIRQ